MKVTTLLVQAALLGAVAGRLEAQASVELGVYAQALFSALQRGRLETWHDIAGRVANLPTPPGYDSLQIILVDRANTIGKVEERYLDRIQGTPLDCYDNVDAPSCGDPQLRHEEHTARLRVDLSQAYNFFDRARQAIQRRLEADGVQFRTARY